MRFLKIFIGIIVILFAIFIAGGFLLPDEWEVSRSTTIHASPEKIYPLISNFREWEKWSPWNTSKDASLKYTHEGPAAGVGSKQSWTSEKMGSGWMQLTSANPETGVAYNLYIDMRRSSSMLQGEITFSRDDQGTKVTWTDRGHSDKSFLKRWMNLLIKPMLGKDLDAGLAGLKNRAEKQ
jgi:hypothetical protein